MGEHRGLRCLPFAYTLAEFIKALGNTDPLLQQIDSLCIFYNTRDFNLHLYGFPATLRMGNEDTDAIARIDVFNIRSADLKMFATSAILTSWQQTWHTLRTKLQAGEENVGR